MPKTCLEASRTKLGWEDCEVNPSIIELENELKNNVRGSPLT